MHVQPQHYERTGTPLPCEQEPAFIDLHQVTRTYPCPGGIVTALHEIDFQVRRGEFVAIVGKSGSGKSTLLNLLTGIDTPTSGQVLVGGTPVHTLNQNRLALWRGESVGIVFQFFQLLPTLTVLENVMLPMDFCKIIPVRDRKARALHLLEQVGIAAHADKLPSALSGGEQQRAAIARAQANDPPLLVADEPTGNLDLQTSDAILNLFRDLVSAGKTLIIVTHEPDIAQIASRTATLSDGRIINLTSHSTASHQHRMQKAAH